MADLQRLGEVAEKILDAYEDALTALDVDLPRTPNTRRTIKYVASGASIAFDLEALVVNLIGIRQGQPGRPVSTAYVTGEMNQSCQFAVTLLRKAVVVNDVGVLADGGLPTVKALSKEGFVQGADLSAMWIASLNVKNSYSIVGPGEGYVLVGVDSIVNEGGLFGTRATLDLSVQ